MTSEVVIDVRAQEISIALLEDKKLVEYQNETRSASFSVGNVYIAKVKKLMPGLNACFVDVGFERDAFLHYLDLGSQFNSYAKYLKQVQSDRKKLYPISKAFRLPDLSKDGSIATTLTVGQEVLVQIVKEPISTKGPRLTGELSFAGRYLVLMPFNDKVSVSTKIKSGEFFLVYCCGDDINANRPAVRTYFASFKLGNSARKIFFKFFISYLLHNGTKFRIVNRKSLSAMRAFKFCHICPLSWK